MDYGDIDSLRAINSEHSNGRLSEPTEKLSWRRHARWSVIERLLRADLRDGTVQAIATFGTRGGDIIAPPVHVPEHHLCIAWISINGGLAGISTQGDSLEVSRTVGARPSRQPVVFPDKGELVINDSDGDDDKLIMVDMTTGEIVNRASSESHLANGMCLTPGVARDIYYYSTFACAKVRWQ